MRRTREIIGLPVLSLHSGQRVGWVQDVIYEEKNNEITGIILESHFFQSAKGIPRKEIQLIGKDALVIDSEELEEIPGVHVTQKIGNHVYNQDGDERGTIQDIFLDDEARTVAGYEVSDGLIADLLQGRGMILQQQVYSDSKDTLVVEEGGNCRELSGM
ncbi:MAG: PRC-barrel domain-containing protein [Peptococcaceae bacterium]|nr:PRC-barrel domain-containing protein [Peptococcaceae bacterium]